MNNQDLTPDIVAGIATKAIHGSDAVHGEHAHITPIYATSAYTFDSAEQGMNRFTGKEKGYTYSRFGNPTTAAAAKVIGTLESFGISNSEGKPLEVHSILHASGQAAMATMFISNLSAGDGILSSNSIYSGTHEFFTNVISGFGINTVFADLRNLDQVEDILKKNKNIKVVHLETPANPTMQCTDIEAVVTIARNYGKKVTIDNTFATPYLQQPFKFGVDFIFHSTTKFLNGHGSAIGGVLIGKDVEFMKTKAESTCKLLGANSNPFDAFLLIQGVKTLPLRMEKHCSNAIQVARFLESDPSIAKVNYNGLPSHPDFAISSKQMRNHGAVMSFELKEGYEKTIQFINKLNVCVRAVSLGTVDTLVSHPASMSHSGMSREDRYKSGVTDGLVRMSVGLEDINDILNDLDQALR